MLKNISCAIGLGLIAVSCSDDTKDRVDNTVRAPELQEDLSGGCEDAGFIPASASTSMKFDTLDFSRTIYLSMDGGCKTRDAQIKYEGQFKIQKANDQQDSIGAMPIDLTYQSVKVTPLTEAGKKVLTTAGAFCGNTSWSVGAEVDLTAHSKETGCVLIDLPEVQYDIVSTEGNVVRFGATGVVKNAPTKAEERPTALNGMSFNK